LSSTDPAAVVFDIGRVMVQWDLAHLYRDLIADDEQRAWFVQNVVSPEWHFQHDAGRPLELLVAERKAQYPEFGPLIDAYATRFLDSIPGEVEGMVALLEELAAADVPIYALTNFADTFWDEFAAEYAWTRHFLEVVVSGKVKLAKPDPAIYALAQERYGRAPEQLFFVDDTPRNVEAARTAGWDAEIFADAATFRAQLAERGFLPA
jgi:2-haloacid dehalogenase